MRIIYKYPLRLTDEVQEVSISGYILTIQIQNGTPVLWAMIDDSGAEISRIKVVGTGHTLPDEADNWSWLATTQDREFVWHWFLIPQYELG